MRHPTMVAMILSAAAAWGQEPRPELAPFPLEIIRTPANSTAQDREDLQKLFPMMLRAAGAAVPDSARLKVALEELRRQDCGRDDACLAQIARRAGSLYAIHVQLDSELDGNVLASGRVVRDDGRALRAPRSARVASAAGTPFRDTAQLALKQLLAALDVGQLAPFRPQEPVASAPTAALTPPVSPVAIPAPQSVRRKPLAALGLAGLGAGTLCMVAGGVIFATAGTARTEVSNGVVRVFPEDADKVAGIQRGEAAGVGLLAVGAAVAVVGAGLLVFGPEQTTTTVAPIAGGAVILMTGRMP